MTSKVQFLLGSSIRLDNVHTLCSTSCFLVPILSNSVLILVWPASRCLTQGHCQSETNGRCVICQQTASRRLEAWSLKSGLVLPTQIFGLFGPPKKRVNFDKFNQRQKCIFCVLTVLYVRIKINDSCFSVCFQ